MTERASCWSITINNPTSDDEQALKRLRDEVWFMGFQSQLEQGENGTPHIQGMLKTTQQRFSTIKKALPRAHIEVARNVKALAQYVQKSDTRLAERDEMARDIPTLFEYQGMVAAEIRYEEIVEYQATMDKTGLKMSMGDAALAVVDAVVARHIASGKRGVEFIAINPMWRSSWKKFFYSIIKRNGGRSDNGSIQEGIQEDEGGQGRRASCASEESNDGHCEASGRTQ